MFQYLNVPSIAHKQYTGVCMLQNWSDILKHRCYNGSNRESKGLQCKILKVASVYSSALQY